MTSFTRLMVIAAALAVISVPAFSLAATFAYVNQAGEVRTVTADTAAAAIMMAPSIDEHSGVLLLDSQADSNIVGDQVQGV